MDDAEIRVIGIEALNKALGPSAALRFLTLIRREPTDYVEISRRLYDGQTAEESHPRRPMSDRRSQTYSASRSGGQRSHSSAASMAISTSTAPTRFGKSVGNARGNRNKPTRENAAPVSA